MSEQPALGPSPEHFELMRSALDHIARTARKSRTSTRRLRWIEKRAELAIKGEPYSDSSFDLPRDAGPNTAEKLKRQMSTLIVQRDELLATLGDIAVYRGEGPAITPWQDIVRDVGAAARAAIAKVKANDGRHQSLCEFIVAGERCSFEAMRTANVDSPDVLAWLERAAPGDAFDLGHSERVQCVAIGATP